MLFRRPLLAIVIAAGLAAALLAPGAGASAQDVVERARQSGVPVPQEILDMLQERPGAFEFRRAWRQRVQDVRANRAALEAMEGIQLGPAQLGPALAAVTGELRVPVLGGLYADDVLPLYSAATYADILFGEAVPPAYSVRTFYREMSRGLFEVVGDIPVWPVLPQGAAYYRPSAGTDPTFGRTGEFLRDVLDALDPTVDFSQYDNDGPDGIPNSGDDDGYVDVATFLYQDAPKSCGGPGIWPHRWVYTGWWGAPYLTDDGVYVDDYMIQAGLQCDGFSAMQIGTFSHELGHALDLPDLYDTDGGSEGIGHWGLMGSGNWNVQSSPAHMGAWSKDYLGWLTVDPLAAPPPGPEQGPQRVSIPGVQLQAVVDSGRVLRYDIPGTDEYFLLENRQPIGSDAFLNGPGLLVWHVDQSVIDTKKASNTVNADPSRFGVDVEEADGLFDLDVGIDRGDSGDPFPGSTGNTAFGPLTTPSSNSNDGFLSGLFLTSIASVGGVVTFDAELGTGLVTVPSVTMAALPGGTAEKTIAVSTLDGAPAGVKARVTEGEPWLVPVPDTAVTPFVLRLTADASGLLNGTYQDTLVLSSLGLDTVRVPVTLNVPGNVIALGDSIADSLTVDMLQDTFVVDLPAGVDVDVVMYSPDYSIDTWVDLYDPNGVLVASNDDFRGLWSMIQGYPVPADGRYTIVARSYWGDDVGPYVLKVREAGPVVATNPDSWFSTSGPEGGVATDTLWIFNAGPGTATFDLTSTYPWLSFTPASGSLPAASPEAREAARALAEGAKERGDRGAWKELRRTGPATGGDDPALVIFRDHEYGIPPGAVAVEVAANLLTAELSAGVYYFSDAVDLASPEDPFGTSSLLDLDVLVHDAAITFIAEGLPYRVAGLDRHALGDLVAAVGGNVERIDPGTGARTVVGGGSPYWSLNGLAAGPDGAVYFTDANDYSVKRVLADGSVETIWVSPSGAPQGVAVVAGPAPPPGAAAGAVPAQPIYVTVYDLGLFRIDPDGTATNVAAGGGYHRAVTYNPLDGMVYYSSDWNLYRYDPATQSNTLLFDMGGSAGEIEVGAGGLLYIGQWDRVRVFNTLGEEQALHYFPDYTWGIALVDGALVGVTEGWWNNRPNQGRVFSLPVADGPVGAGGTYLVAEWPTLFVQPGGSATELLRVRTQDGTPVDVSLTWDAPWLDVAPVPLEPPLGGPLPGATAGTTPLDLDVTVDASGLALGVYVDTLEITSAAVDNSPYRIPITVRHGNTLVLGDSVTGRLDVLGETDTFDIALTTNSVVDIAAFPTDGSPLGQVDFRVLDATGATVAYPSWRPLENGRAGAVLPGWRVWSNGPGTHRIVVQGWGTGGYVLKARPAGPLVATEWSWLELAAAEGGSDSDTIYVFNTGPTAVTWAAESAVPWLTVQPAGGTLPAGGPEAAAALAAASEQGRTRERLRHSETGAIEGGPDASPRLGFVKDPALAPPDAVPVEVTVDFASFSRGYSWYQNVLSFDLPSDPWGGPAFVGLDLFVHEPGLAIVADRLPDFTSDVARHPDGDLVLASGGDVLRVDPTTGERTLLASGVSAYPWYLYGVAAAPDGTVYVADAYGNAIKAIDPFGQLTVLWSPPSDYVYDVTVAGDGTVYAVTYYDGLWRIDGPGSATNVATSEAACCHYATVFNPTDGRVYFSQGYQVLAWDPSTEAAAEVGFTRDWVRDLEVGSSGLLYAHAWGSISAYQIGSLIETARYATPGSGWGIALTDGQLWGTTEGCCGNVTDEGLLYRIPVADGPAEAGGRYLVTTPPLRTRTVWPGEVVTDTLSLVTSDGVPVDFTVAEEASWLDVTPLSGTTPGQVVLTLDAAGLAGGTYETGVVFSSADVASDLTRVVRMDVARTLAVGDSAFTTLPVDVYGQPILLDLQAGAAVDVVAQVVPGTVEGPWLGLYGSGGTPLRGGTRRTGPDGALIAAFVAPATDTYEVRLSGEAGKTYLVKARAAADVVVGDPSGFSLWSPDGGPVSDTLWLYNTGPGTPAWELVGSPPSWLGLSQTSGTLAPAAGPPAAAPASEAAGATDEPMLPTAGPERVTRRPPPAGATAIVLTADPAALREGESLEALLAFRMTGDGWAGDQAVEVELEAVDPSLTHVASLPSLVMDVLVASPTELLVTVNGDLWKVDRSTGGTTRWVTDLSADASFPLVGIEATDGGAVYVADQTGRVIHRVESDGSHTVAMELETVPYDPIVLPDRTLIASTYRGFYRLGSDGLVTLLAEDPALKRAAYHPLEGWIYYTTGDGFLKRVHPETGSIEVLADTEDFVTAFDIGASGNLYAATVDGGLHFVDPALEPFQEFPPWGQTSYGVALGAEGDDVVYVTTRGFDDSNGHVYARTVADYRALLPPPPGVEAWVDDPIAFPGDTVDVSVWVDLHETGRALGAFNAELRWDTARATFVSLDQGDLVGAFESNVAGADTGFVAFAGLNADDLVNRDTVRVASFRFALRGVAGDTGPLDLEITSMEATDFWDLTQTLVLRDGLVTLATGYWGDPNRGSTVSALDALLCLTHTVGRALPEGSVPEACDVAPDVDGDSDGVRETFDGTITSLDALAILSHVVGKVLPAEYRVGVIR